MSRRTLCLATAVLWVGAAGLAAAQNLEAGKSPVQIFSATCAVCHKSPHGLLKSVAPGSLPGFLRQHYTTSTGMADAMSAYVLSNGAATRAKDEKPVRGHAAKPKDEGIPETEARDKKPKADKRKPKHVPAQNEPKAVPQPKPETPAAGSDKPVAAPEKPEPAETKPAVSAPDNAAEAPAKKPDAEKPASSNMPVFNIEPKPETKPAEAPAVPAPDKPAQ